MGNITKYPENRADVDRLRLENLGVLPAPSTSSPNPLSLYSFLVWPRGRVPPQPQHSVWGHQSGKSSNSHERSVRALTVFPA
jgi:hypothetical protein